MHMYVGVITIPWHTLIILQATLERALSEAQEEHRKNLEEALREERERSAKAIETALEEERSRGTALIEELKVGGV